MNVLWFSAGVSSAVVGYICRGELDRIVYQHIDDQHKDTLRFLYDCQNLFGKSIEVRQSPYQSVENVCRTSRVIKLARFAKCTEILKKRERKLWELDNPGRHTYYWGFDFDERNRAERVVEAMPDFDHRFPLIERQLKKEDCHGIFQSLRIRRPAMYDLGYSDNNCIGCIKGGMGYWNKIRVDFPEVFARRAKMERDIGRSCIKEVFLDELDPNAGRMEKEISTECGIFCELNK